MSQNARRGATWAAAGLLALHGILAWLCRAPGIDYGGDDAKYLLLARSLRAFSYRELWIDGTPFHAQYPPVFPGTLALYGLLVGDRFDLLILFNIACSVTALAVAFHVVRRLSSDGVALCTLAVLAVNPFLVMYAGLLISEPMFTALSTMAVALLARDAPSTRQLALASILAIAAALTRIIGVPLLAAVLAVWLLQRRWKGAALFAGASGALVGVWVLWTVRHAASAATASQTYLTPAADVVGRAAVPQRFVTQVIGRGMDYVTLSVPQVLSAPTVAGTLFDNLLAIAVIGIGIVVGLVAMRRTWTALGLYLAFTLALLAVWPINENRFVTPLVPVLTAALMLGIDRLAGFKKPAWGRAAACLVSVFLVVGCVLVTAERLETRGECRRGTLVPDASCEPSDAGSFFAAVAWVRDSVPDSAVVLSSKPSVLYYYSGRRSVLTKPLAVRGDSTQLLARLREARAGWVLLANLNPSEHTAGRRLLRNCTELSLAASFPPRTYLFRIAEGPGADSTACRALENYRRVSYGRDFNRDR